MPDLRLRSWIEVSRRRIALNYQSVKSVVGPEVEVCPVVKADAYRHGAIEVARTLEAEGANWFAVSSTEEGIVLRQASVNGRILLMAESVAASGSALTEFNLTPVLHSLDEIALLGRLSPNQPIPFHLKLDTGMGRLGALAEAEAIATALRSSPTARLEGLMTHFASAANYSSPQTDEQIEAFESLLASLQPLNLEPEIVHLSSTIPVAYGRRRAWRSMVRTGHAIYGYVSPVRVRPGETAPTNLLDVRPALTWKARILTIKDMPAGARIGYGAMHRTERPTRIGILAAGYADGIPHKLSNRGRVIAGGRWAPILGAVSMDVTTINLTEAPHLQPGDSVTLMGEEAGLHQDAQEIARIAGTISYSVLCGISARVERLYVD